MIDILFIFVCLCGFFYAVQTWLKIRPEFSPFFCFSFIGIFLYCFAVSGQLRLGTDILIYAGIFFFMFFLKDQWENRKNLSFQSILKSPWILFAILAGISFILAMNMAFTVIDDYVYWGIIGKYLYLNDHLPVTGNPLDPRILAYTPGTAIIHYFFYSMFNEHSPDISYFAQTMILISALFVVVQKENYRKTIVYMGALIILLAIFSGSIFTKLQVDYLLSITIFSIFWIYCSKEKYWLKLLTISMPICFLFLIKEIGFVIGLFVLITILCDTIMNKMLEHKIKLRSLGILLIIGAGLLALKMTWTYHFIAMGFEALHKGINLDSIKKTLPIFSDPQVRDGFIIFIKAIFFESADRMSLPYLIWYTGMAYLVMKLFKQNTKNNQQRFYVFSGLILTTAGLYLFLLYCLQIIMFNVGTSFDHTIGFSRYWNILFSPIVFMVVLSFLRQILLKHSEIGKKTIWSVLVIVILILGASRIEVSLHREKEDIVVEQVSLQISDKIPTSVFSIGIISGKYDNLASLQFLYYLLPNRVDHGSPKFKTRMELIHYTKKYDYVIVYHPESETLEWLTMAALRRAEIFSNSCQRSKT